jgi:sensor domain CHASE-containing protein
MLSQPGIPIVLAAILSSILSGTLLIVNNIINHKFQLEREKQQGIRQQESDQKNWHREKIYDSYKTSIQVLTKIVQGRYQLETAYDIDQDESINLEKLYFEFNSEFEMIMAGYPDKDSEKFKEKMANIKKYLNVEPLLARIIITEMMEDDSRIKVINK